jgi:hypothetical protein
VEAYILSEQRVRARGLWERWTGDRSVGVCVCGHTKAFHDVYHQRAGEWEECWPSCGNQPCAGARNFCEVCEECAGFSDAFPADLALPGLLVLSLAHS